MTSDEIVKELQPYGRVFIHQHDDDTFSANLSLRFVGIEAKVKSGYNNRSMLEALVDLQRNVMTAVSPLGNVPKLDSKEKS